MRRVTEPSSVFRSEPIMAHPIKVRPKAAVATGSVLWICRARSAISFPVMATALTVPSAAIMRTISSMDLYHFLSRCKKYTLLILAGRA